MEKQVWRIDREGWQVGITSAGDLYVGTGDENEYYKDTPENRKFVVDYWKANSFAREVKI